MPQSHHPVADHHAGVELAAVLADDPLWTDPRPTVLVVHGAEGRSDAQLEFADRVVALGYRALAVDLFGAEVSAAGADALWAAMTGFLTDREALRSASASAARACSTSPASMPRSGVSSASTGS